MADNTTKPTNTSIDLTNNLRKSILFLVSYFGIFTVLYSLSLTRHQLLSIPEDPRYGFFFPFYFGQGSGSSPVPFAFSNLGIFLNFLFMVSTYFLLSFHKKFTLKRVFILFIILLVSTFLSSVFIQELPL